MNPTSTHDRRRSDQNIPRRRGVEVLKRRPNPPHRRLPSTVIVHLARFPGGCGFSPTIYAMQRTEGTPQHHCARVLCMTDSHEANLAGLEQETGLSEFRLRSAGRQ